jgi:hypothetical protein
LKVKRNGLEIHLRFFARAPPMTRVTYRVNIPMTGFLATFETESSSVLFPAGSVLTAVSGRNGALLGMARVLWQGREYSVFQRDLAQKCERLNQAAGR